MISKGHFIGLEKKDLLPDHGWFPKLFQNIFILKSHKRMFSETKVKKKRNVLVLIQSTVQCKKKICHKKMAHINTASDQSDTAKQAGCKAGWLQMQAASAYSLATVVEVTAVTGVALHTQVTCHAWGCWTGHLEVKNHFMSLLFEPVTLAERNSACGVLYLNEQGVKYVAYVRCSLTGVILTAASVQRSEVLRWKIHMCKYYYFYSANVFFFPVSSSLFSDITCVITTDEPSSPSRPFEASFVSDKQTSPGLRRKNPIHSNSVLYTCLIYIFNTAELCS